MDSSIENEQFADSPDWATKATATVVKHIGSVRDKTTGPALAASRSVVYIFAIGLIVLMLLVVAFIALTRATVSATSYLSFVDPGETWLAYSILGVLFIFVGMFFWRKKEA